MKRFSFFDSIFLLAASIFIVLASYEIVQLLTPFYTFGKVLICFTGLSFFYAYTKYQQENTYVKKYMQIFRDHIPSFVYTGFILMLVLIFLALISGQTLFLPWIFAGACIFFIFAKIHGFHFEYSLIQSSPKDNTTWKLLILSLAFFIIILSHLFIVFALAFDIQKEYYFLTVSIYSILGVCIFFDWKKYIPKNIFDLKHVSQLKNISVYHLLSCIFIISLGVMLYLDMKTPAIQESEIPQERVQEQISEPVLDFQEEVKIILVSQKVSQVYPITVGLQVGSTGQSVTNLQTVLQKLSYLTGTVSGTFDETTRLALKKTLISECEWPESTRGIFGNEAKACIDNLEVVFP